MHWPITGRCLRINHLTWPFSKHYPVKSNPTHLSVPPPLGKQSRLLPQARAGKARAKSQQSPVTTTAAPLRLRESQELAHIVNRTLGVNADNARLLTRAKTLTFEANSGAH